MVAFDDGDEELFPISPHKMGPPAKNSAIEGRANPKGIPYLYLSTNEDTAIAEKRPWIGAEVTLGYFEILEDLNIVDTSTDKPKNPLTKFNKHFEIRSVESYSDAEKEEYIWGDINYAFSKPISANESTLKYLPTQFLSEKLKTIGYDGIAYKSSLREDGHNICLFYPDKAKCFGCNIFTINKIKYEYEKLGNSIKLSEDNKVLYSRITDIKPIEPEK